MHLRLSAPSTAALFALAAIATATGCRREGASRANPRFVAAWDDLATRGIAPMVIEPDHGEAMLDSVHRMPAHTRARPVAVAAPAPVPEPTPGVAQDDLMRIIRGGLGGLKSCYKLAEQRGVTASGKAIVSFKILPEGSVDGVQVGAPAFEDSQLPACLQTQVRAWQFPKFEGQPMEVSYPFVFIGG